MLHTNFVEQGEAVAIGQTYVAEYQIETFHPEADARGCGRGCGGDAVAAGLEPHRL